VSRGLGDVYKRQLTPLRIIGEKSWDSFRMGGLPEPLRSGNRP